MTPDQIDRLPPHVQEIARHAAELAPARGFSPWLVLGLAFAESNFGRALRNGSGDYIPRPSNPARDARLKKTPLPGAVLRTLADGIPARKLKGPIAAWVPMTHGWGVGVFQIDWEAHHSFIARGTWRDVRACMAYALEVLSDARAHLSQACGLRGDELLDATVAAYNAGAGRVAKFIREGKSLDGATFHPGYVAKIKKKADELAGASGAWRSPPPAAGAA
jgi:hypothetical protein